LGGEGENGEGLSGSEQEEKLEGAEMSPVDSGSHVRLWSEGRT
jgi:hypothetical protein